MPLLTVHWLLEPPTHHVNEIATSQLNMRSGGLVHLTPGWRKSQQCELVTVLVEITMYVSNLPPPALIMWQACLFI